MKNNDQSDMKKSSKTILEFCEFFIDKKYNLTSNHLTIILTNHLSSIGTR